MSDSTETIARRHWAAYCQGDVAGLIADYAEDAVLLTDATGAVQGRAAIEAVFHGLFRDALPVATTRFELVSLQVHGELALIKWSVATPAFRTRGASDTLIVRGGKIVAQTGAAEIEPLA